MRLFVAVMSPPAISPERIAEVIFKLQPVGQAGIAFQLSEIRSLPRLVSRHSIRDDYRKRCGRTFVGLPLSVTTTVIEFVLVPPSAS